MEILERLRELEAAADQSDIPVTPISSVELQQAADEIERLQSKLAHCESLLRGFSATFVETRMANAPLEKRDIKDRNSK